LFGRTVRGMLLVPARSRDVFPDWDRVADEQAFDLWLGPSAERSAQFQAELAPIAGAEFTLRLNRHAVPPRGRWRWRHPMVGELRLEREVHGVPGGRCPAARGVPAR
jgi:hypothetical protein